MRLSEATHDHERSFASYGIQADDQTSSTLWNLGTCRSICRCALVADVNCRQCALYPFWESRNPFERDKTLAHMRRTLA